MRPRPMPAALRDPQPQRYCRRQNGVCPRESSLEMLVLPGVWPGIVIGWDAIAGCGGQSSVNDRNRSRPPSRSAAYLYGEAAHHEAGRGNCLQVVQFFDMAIADIAAGPVSLPDERCIVCLRIFFQRMDE